MRSSTRGAPLIDHGFLLRLEQTAAGMISIFVNSRLLTEKSVTHELRPAKTSPTPSSIDRNSVHIPILFIRLSSLMYANQVQLAGPWAKETIKVTYQGVTTRAGQAVSVVEAKLENPVSVSNKTDNDVTFHPISGAFAIKLRAPVGEEIVPKLLSRLRRLERLSRLFEVTQKFKLHCSSISLDRIIFAYHTDPHLQADIGFVEGVPMTFRLANSNPHLRIKDYLTASLNSKGGLEHVALLLGITRPLLSTMDSIERLRDSIRVYFLPRSADWLQVKYKQPSCSFDVRLRMRRDDTKWFVSQAQLPPPGPNLYFDSEGFAIELKTLFVQSGFHWMGLGTGIVAGVDGVSEVIRRIHDLVERFRKIPVSEDTPVVEPKPPDAEREVVILE